MIVEALRRAKLVLSPPKPGDIYYGDVLFFVLGNNIEFVLHGLTNKNGDPVYSPVPSEDGFRLTILEYAGPGFTHYVCNSEIFCRDVPTHPYDLGNWRKRTQVRRLPVKYFKDLIVNGLLTKGKL